MKEDTFYLFPKAALCKVARGLGALPLWESHTTTDLDALWLGDVLLNLCRSIILSNDAALLPTWASYQSMALGAQKLRE